MQFVDLDKIKIRKAYNFKTNELEIDLNNTATIFDIKERTRQAFNYFVESSGIENYYNVILNRQINESDDSEEIECYFLTAVNIISAVFFDVMCTTKGRPRERRLDVPENLKVLKTNMSLLKRAINAQTLVDCFNLTICWSTPFGELIYELVPQSKEEE